MSLKKDETDLGIIITALSDSNYKERSRAITRLKNISSDLSINEIVKINNDLHKCLLSETNERLKKRIDYLIKNHYNKEEPEIIEMDYEEPEHFEFELGDSTRKKAPKKRHIDESTVIRNNSFRSMHSDQRFPIHIWYIDIIRVFAFLFFMSFTIAALYSLWWLMFGPFVIFMSAAIVGTFSILLSSEIIRFMLDFHDSNYTNTKVRIETLKVLKEISKKLRR